jgi:hypothetical protein
VRIAIVFQAAKPPDRWGMFVESLGDPNNFSTSIQVCISSSVSWLEVRSAAPGCDEKPPNMTPTLRYDPVTGRTSES